MTKNKSLIIGLITALVSFILLYIGMKYVGNRDISGNIIPYGSVSLIFGLVMAVFHHFKLKYAFNILLLGAIIGFFEMFRRFLSNLSGWEDLAGIISLMFWIIIGFFVGIIVQGVVYLYKRYKK